MCRGFVKWITLAVIALAFTTAIAAYADEVWQLPERICDLVPFEDHVIAVLGDGTVYLCDERKEAPDTMTVLIDGQELKGMPYLFTGQGNRLYAIIRRDGGYYLCNVAVENAALVLTVQHTIPFALEEPGLLTVMSYDEGVVILAEDNLSCWNPDSQSTATWQGWGHQPLLAGGGKLLTWQENASLTELQEVRIASHSMSKSGVLDVWTSDLAVSPDGTILAWYKDAIVTARQNDTEDMAGYLGYATPMEKHPCAVTNSGQFFLADGTRLMAVQLSASFSEDQEAIVIGDVGMEDAVITRFREQHPEVQVITRTLDFRYSPADIVQAIRSGDQSVDIYLVRTNDLGYRAMLEKGFCADLSGDAELMRQVADMPEQIASALMSDGKLLAIPYSAVFSGIPLGCSQRALDAMGLSMDDVPTNLDELLDALILWLEDGRMDQIWLSDSHSDERSLYGIVVNSYNCLRRNDSGYVDLSEPGFRDIMLKYDRVEKLLQTRERPDDDAPALLSQKGLSYFLSLQLWNYAPLGMGDPISLNEAAQWQMLELSLYPDEEAFISLSLDVAVVNPLSPNREEAIAILGYMLSELPPQDAIYFWPERAVPVETENYIRLMESCNTRIAKLNQRLESNELSLSERELLENELADELQIAAMLEEDRWLVTEEAIELYRAVKERLTVTSSDMMSVIWTEGGLSIESRYFDGQATIEQLIETFANLSRSVIMENQ